MASQALNQIEEKQLAVLQREYGGKQANQFVDELKSSTLFQFNWGELLGAAPTALSLMGSCWIAAADPVADKIVMTKAIPIGGFKYIVNRSTPTLRTILVDVCNNGGREAFTLAGANMAALQVRAHSICTERINLIFKRLPGVTKGPDELQDFNDALADFADEARTSAELATKTREAFSLWGKMVGELHSATENQQNQTSIERGEAQAAETIAEIDKTFAVEASAAAKENVELMHNQLSKAEKRLDTALDKVPGPWETVVQGLVTSFTQAIPTLMNPTGPMTLNPANAVGTVPTVGGTAVSQASDPAYVAATEIRDLVTHLYEFLGGEKGTIDWSRFENATEGKGKDQKTSCAYLLAIFKGRKSHTDITNTIPNQTFMKQLDALIALITDIDEIQKNQTDFKAESISKAKLEEWKSIAKTAQLEIVKIASSVPTQGGNMSTPTGFGRVDAPKPDQAAQNAQLSTAMQGVQMAQNAVDLAQSNFDASIKKQQETAKAMLEVEKRLKSLQEKGKTLDEIKTVLRDCIAVLVDLVVQISKLEKFFTMLTTVIDNVVLPIAERFKRDMTRVGERSSRDKFISVSDTTKQTIYISTLQLKAYFSLLEDIASMYSFVDSKYIAPGMDLCTQLSAGSASKTPIDQLTKQLTDYTASASKDVAALVNKRQSEMLAGLRDRAKTAADTSKVIEDTVRNAGATIDASTKQAIDAGKVDAAKASEAMIQGQKSATALRNENLKDL